MSARTAAPAAPPLDPSTPEGAAAERQLNEVLAGVLTRLAREEALPAAPPAVPSPARPRSA